MHFETSFVCHSVPGSSPPTNFLFTRRSHEIQDAGSAPRPGCDFLSQTATPTTPSTPQIRTPAAKCACSGKMASADAHACCAHNAGARHMASCSTGKLGASGCAGMDAKSAAKTGKDKCGPDCDQSKTANACCASPCGKQCADGKCCGANNAGKAASCCPHRTLSLRIDPGTIFPW